MTTCLPMLDLIGSEVEVSIVTGGQRRYVNANYAATTPCLASVKRAVDELLPWYSAVGRGADVKSKISTAVYADARDMVRDFVSARPDDCVLFTRNTTDSINLMVSVLPDEATIVTWDVGHHSTLLPPRRRHVMTLVTPDDPGVVLDELEVVLQERHVDLIIVTGASNVTGEIWPYQAITKLAHEHGARVLLDAAQLAAHHVIDMRASDVDYVAFSGHKVYAPFGAGVLIGRCQWLSDGRPYLAGGGAVDFVRVDDVVWTQLPDRQEAGSPNVIGAHALATACQSLQTLDRVALLDREVMLIDTLQAGLSAIPGMQLYRTWPDQPRVGTLTFNLIDRSYAEVGAIASAEHAIGLRDGCFCAHPLLMRLLGIDDERAREIMVARQTGQSTSVPGAVRASIGAGTTIDDVLAIIEAIIAISRGQVAWSYQSSPDGTSCWPVPDSRIMPSFIR